MKIALAQIYSSPGGIDINREKHHSAIINAVQHECRFIFFPELSLTAYEPALAASLAMNKEDPHLDFFQQLSNELDLVIGLGIPTCASKSILISMAIFQPFQKLIIYSKQLLHSDEEPYFSSGQRSVTIKSGNYCIAPAICYESLQLSHLSQSLAQGANIYLASVAKSTSSLQSAYDYYRQQAHLHSVHILMVNNVGQNDNFISGGKSAIWTPDGSCAGFLDQYEEALLVYDFRTLKASKVTLI